MTNRIEENTEKEKPANEKGELNREAYQRDKNSGSRYWMLKPDLDLAGNCMFKVNNRNTRRRCEICSKLTIKTPYFTPRSSVFIVNFEQVNAD